MDLGAVFRKRVNDAGQGVGTAVGPGRALVQVGDATNQAERTVQLVQRLPDGLLLNFRRRRPCPGNGLQAQRLQPLHLSRRLPRGLQHRHRLLPGLIVQVAAALEVENTDSTGHQGQQDRERQGKVQPGPNATPSIQEVTQSDTCSCKAVSGSTGLAEPYHPGINA